MQTDTPASPSQPAVRLHFVVVGGGIGGLSAAVQLSRAGHAVTLLEAAQETGDAGAGINVPPNAARILIGLGLGDVLRDFGVQPNALVYRRWASGDVLARHSTEEIKRKHGAPYYNIHRGHLTQGLIDAAQQYKHTKLRFGCLVASIEPAQDENARSSVTLADGERIEGDVIIGADGIRSLARQAVTGSCDRPLNTGDVAFRSLIPTELMLADPDLAPLVTNHEVTVWLGPGRHIVAYCINGKRAYHLALARADEAQPRATESWVVEADPNVMREGFETWEPRVTKLLALVQTANKRRLVDRVPLDRWSDPASGRVLLLGDACHPMLPYRAQGAAMAMEDAATLGVLFAQVASRGEIAALVQAYQRLRAPRCSQAQNASRANRHVFHLPDGAQQQARDARLATLTANPIAMEEDNRTTFDYDAVAVAKAWVEEYRRSEHVQNEL